MWNIYYFVNQFQIMSDESDFNDAMEVTGDGGANYEFEVSLEENNDSVLVD